MNYVYVNGVEVQVVRRRVKNMSLRINQSDGTVMLVVPMRVPMYEAAAFLRGGGAGFQRQCRGVCR